MKPNTLAALAWMAAGALLFFWWRKHGRPGSPARVAAAQTPIATRNSEDIRDAEQAANNGQARALGILMTPPTP